MHHPLGPLRTRRELPDWLAIILIALLPLCLVFAPTNGDFVPVTLTNSTGYQLTVSASTPGDATRSQVMVIGPGETVTIDEVIDRGSTWMLHVAVNGVEAPQMRVTRSELTDAAAPFDITAAVGEQLVAGGAGPAPTPSR